MDRVYRITRDNWPEKNAVFRVNEITLFQSVRTDGKLSYLSIEKVRFKR